MQQINRRRAIQTGCAVGAVMFINPTWIWAADAKLPPDIPLQQRLDAILLGRKTVRGGATLEIPPVVEDGTLVPVKFSVKSPMTAQDHVKTLFLLVDKNPDPLVMTFHLSPLLGVVNFETKIRMREQSDVRLIAETSKGELWEHKLFVKATGGCG